MDGQSLHIVCILNGKILHGLFAWSETVTKRNKEPLTFLFGSNGACDFVNDHEYDETPFNLFEPEKLNIDERKINITWNSIS